MSDAGPPEIDPRRVRLGLAMLVVVLLVALALALVIDDPLGRLIMAGIVLFAVARTYVLVRAQRAGRLR